MNPDEVRVRPVDPDRLLVVEDSAEDTEAIARALAATHPRLEVEFADRTDGLLERLTAAERLPGMMLLDLNMPGTGGHRLLRGLRAVPALRELIVVVFTSSTSAAEVDASYAAGADSHIYKPINFDLFRTVLQGAVDYWQPRIGESSEGRSR
ncbi:response regulator [Streptomyces sp. BI20]|uniref:response regulator n=1 Tax=Streptomyces sp. BI20 TaxID=3403460 RepID=UPI003C77CA35